MEADGMVKGWNRKTRSTRATSSAMAIVLTISHVSWSTPDFSALRPRAERAEVMVMKSLDARGEGVA
jgi:hypothetical protein